MRGTEQRAEASTQQAMSARQVKATTFVIDIPLDFRNEHLSDALTLLRRHGHRDFNGPYGWDADLREPAARKHECVLARETGARCVDDALHPCDPQSPAGRPLYDFNVEGRPGRMLESNWARLARVCRHATLHRLVFNSPDVWHRTTGVCLSRTGNQQNGEPQAPPNHFTSRNCYRLEPQSCIVSIMAYWKRARSLLGRLMSGQTHCLAFPHLAFDEARLSGNPLP